MAAASPDSFHFSPARGDDDSIRTTLHQYQRQTQFTDFKINVEGKVIDCHRIILSATCPYFESMLRSEMAESEKGEVIMNNMSCETMIAVVDFLYTRTISVKWDEVESMIEACEMLQIQELKGQLDEYISDNIKTDICITWWRIADQYDLEKAGEKAKAIMYSEFELVSKSDDFKLLSYAELVDYIASENIMDDRRDAALIACLEWVHYDTKSRSTSMLELLNQVEIDKCSRQGLEQLTRDYKHLIADIRVKELLYETVIPKLGKEEVEEVKRFVALGGNDRHMRKHNSLCWMTNSLDEGNWKEFAEFPPEVQDYLSPVVVLPQSGFAVICGGDNYTTNTMYNVTTKQWSTLPVSPISAKNISALFCYNAIYILGGTGKYRGRHGAKYDTVHHLDLTTKQWHQDPSMLQKQSWPIAASIKNTVFVVHNDYTDNPQAPYHTLQAFDVCRKTWSYQAPLPQNSPRTTGASLVPVDDALYLVGGTDRNCSRYKASTNTWTRLTGPSYYTFHGHGSAVLSEGRVYICGGYGENSDRFEEYDTTVDKWRTMKVRLPSKLGVYTVAKMCFPKN